MKLESINKYIKKISRRLMREIKISTKQILTFLRTNLMVEIFLIVNIINGIILRNYTVKNIFAIKPVLGDLTFLLIISSFVYFIKPKRQVWYLFIWSIVCSLVCFINCTYYSNYISFSSFSMLSTATELTGYTDAVFENVLEYKDFIFFIQPFILLFFHLQLRKKDYYKKVSKIERSKKRFLIALSLALVSLGAFITKLTSTDLSRLNKQWNRSSVVMEFGIYVYQSNDLFSCVKTKVNTMFGYDSAAKMFREHYASIEPKKENKYTNIFEGKNVLVIHAESIQSFALNLRFNGLDLTPNLNRIASEGIYFSNFYAEESTGTSSDSEFTFATSLLPASSGTVFMNYFDRDYITIQKLMKEKGYYTFGMHGNNGSSWNRDVAYKYLGYDKFYEKQSYKIDETIGLGLSDKSFFRQSVSKIKKINNNHDKWYGLLVMLTNHTPFSDINNYSDYLVDIQNEETQEHFLENTKMGNYLKSVNYADSAIGELFENLDANGLLDNTVVVIYGDHDAKLKTSEFERLYNSEYIDSCLIDPTLKIDTIDDYTYELNRKVPFIIWTKDMTASGKAEKIDKPMGMIDASPTLLNMLGSYNEYALGHDMFSVDSNMIVFPSGNWLTDKLYYNSSKREYRPLSDESITIEEIEKNNEYANMLIDISNGIINYDLIKRVNEVE